MNQLFKRISICFSVFCASLMFSYQALAITMSFDPSDSFFEVGESIGVDIVISGMESDNLAGFDFNVNYDQTILEFDSYNLGTELGDIDPFDPFADAEDWSFGDLGGGTINLAEISYLADFSFQPDSFILATVYFTGSDLGNSFLNFSDVILGDEFASPLSADLKMGSISPVPEPATILLLASGMAGMGVFGRKKIRKKDK